MEQIEAQPAGRGHCSIVKGKNEETASEQWMFCFTKQDPLWVVFQRFAAFQRFSAVPKTYGAFN